MQTSKIYGYIRVSTKDQKQDRQLTEMLEMAIPRKFIYCDIASGKDFNRPKYQKLKRRLQEGDTLVIKTIDRLGRNYNDIIQEWRDITKNMKANIKVLDLPLLDTTVKDRDLTGVFISDIVLQILSYVAEQERSYIRQRQKEGIAIAKARGKQFGRPKLEIPLEFKEVYQKWQNGEIASKTAMEMLGLKRTTFYRMVKIYKSSL